MKEKLRKFKVIIIGTSIFLILLFILIGYMLFFNKHKIEEYSNKIYSIKYDNTWKLKENKKDYILLQHDKKSKIEISIKTLDEEVRYNDIHTFIDDVKKLIEESNTNYKLISQKKDSVTKRELEGYKLLYEGKESQSYVVLSKYNDKLFTIAYEAQDDEFDILLDSVSNIIYNFQILDDAVNIEEELNKIKTTGINYSSKEKVFSSKKFEHEIADYDFVVNYKLTKDLEDSDFNSRWHLRSMYKDINNKEERISTEVGISYTNIYEYINESIETKVENYKKGDYKNIKLENERIKSKGLNGFIYKISYDLEYDGITDNGDFGKKVSSKEEFTIIYPIDTVRTLYYKIEANKGIISENEVKSFEIVDYKKVGAYITRNVKDGYIYNTMKTFYKGDSLNDKSKYYEITLKTPEKYKEKSIYAQNIYDSRFFGLDFDEISEEYKYNVIYRLNNLNVDTTIQSAKETINSYKNGKFTYVREFEKNKNKFKYYKATYKSTTGKTSYEKAYLFTSLNEKQTLSLEISTENDIIDIDMIEGLLNIDIKIKDYKK